MELNGKIAFITGGGGGIGTGLAQAFAEKGMRLVLADLDEESARCAVEPFGDQAIALTLDVTSLQSWSDAREKTASHFGPPDVLCNNAGVSIPWQPLIDLSPEQFDHAIKANLYGVYNGIKTFAPDMIARRSGHIVNTSSFNGLIAMGTMGGYSASKFAVTGLSVALRQEMAEHGIGVSTVYPGATKSRMLSAIEDRHAKRMRSQVAMEPLWIGRAVVSAIENNAPHVISHPHLRPAYDAWVAELSASFGDPADPDYRPEI